MVKWHNWGGLESLDCGLGEPGNVPGERRCSGHHWDQWGPWEPLKTGGRNIVVTPTVAGVRRKQEETVGVLIGANIIPLAQIVGINSYAHGSNRKKRWEW